MTTQQADNDALREQVRARYAAAATKVTSGQGGCGCGQPADCGCDDPACCEVSAARLVRLPDVALLPMRAEVLKGHLDGLLLAVLEAGPLHGYAVMEALRTGSGGRVDLTTGTVYPALHRLEQAGLVRGHWSTEGGRRRRSYELTPAGNRALAGERSSWQEFATTVSALLEGRPSPAPA